MYSLTKHRLDEFDNQHDFERMCADILNAIGYKNVTPIAPKGGSDGGRDITFETESDGKGLACVTLRKDFKTKFYEDFKKRSSGDYEKYYFFSNRYITADQKVSFAKHCITKLNAELIIQDVEALRSLLDSALKDVRLRYLNIDDSKTEQLKKHLKKVMKYPETLSREAYKDRANQGEWILTSPMEREIYYFICDIEDEDMVEIPNIGSNLLSYKEAYYKLITELTELMRLCKEKIGTRTKTEFQFIYGWNIYFRYYVLRNSGIDSNSIKRLVSTNYEISYEDCEIFFEEISKIQTFQVVVEKIAKLQTVMHNELDKIKKELFNK